MTSTSVITPAHLAAGYSYEAYQQMIATLLAEGKTTGANHSEAMLHYTELNLQRMHRLDKTAQLTEAVQEKLLSVIGPWTWLVLTEAWCGDAAQSIPLMAKMAESSPHITLKLLLRDEYPEVMDAYLTNGSRSIPKLICLTEDLRVVGTWGPRPAEAQQLMNDFKQQHPDEGYQALAKEMQLWYARDRTQAIQKELSELLVAWS
jgi:hypothetical protein